MAGKDLDLVGKLGEDEARELLFAQQSICPDDAKYRKDTLPIRNVLSPFAEWTQCVHIQNVLLEKRRDFGFADDNNVAEMREAVKKVNPLNIALLEDKLRHDQQAVLAELGRFVSLATRARAHPGTTSYDILDTTRAMLLKRAWNDVMKPKTGEVIEQFCDFAETSMDVIQVGRTHLQDTSPVPFGVTMAGYARRLAERIKYLDVSFGDLRGKIRGIVGTGASIEMVVGAGRASAFEREVLSELGLEPDFAATQITQKERLADVGHGIVTLAHVLGDFAGDVRLLYSSAIKELVSSDGSKLLGGSSADAAKDNPVNWENMEGKIPVVESGMIVLYPMIITDLQRDLRGSVQGRYQPQMMIAQTYEMLVRISKAMKTLGINRDKMDANLRPFREFPSEAMVAILRGEGWYHPDFGDGHDFVKMMSQRAKAAGRSLLNVALEEGEFAKVYHSLPEAKKRILNGEIELYLGDSKERAIANLAYARSVISA